MGAMALRNIPDDVHRRIKSVAESRGISVEEAARQLLDEATRPAERISQVIGAFVKEKGVSFPDIARKQDSIEPAVFE